jgi:hypothetical protein
VCQCDCARHQVLWISQAYHVCTPVAAASVARGASAEFSRRCTVLALPLRRRAPYQGLTASYAATLNLGSKAILHGTATLQYGPDAQHWRDDSRQQRSVPTDAGYRNRRSKTTANPQGGVAWTRCRVAKHLIGHASAVTLANAHRGEVKYSTLLEHSARSVSASGAGPSCVHMGGADSESCDHRSYLRVWRRAVAGQATHVPNSPEGKNRNITVADRLSQTYAKCLQSHDYTWLPSFVARRLS